MVRGAVDSSQSRQRVAKPRGRVKRYERQAIDDVGSIFLAGRNGGWMIIPTLFWLAPLGVVIWGVVRLTSGRGASSGRNVMQAPPDLTAEEILKRRYASGEIDAQTYESM